MSKERRPRVLAVIPARGGSKEIPRKNLRLLNGRPLIAYQVENAVKSEYVTDVVVSSDNELILDYAASLGVSVRHRPSALAADAVTLDPVVFDAVEFMEDQEGARYDAVVTLQPTSPLLRVETLNRALTTFFEDKTDTLIPVVDATHLYWREREGTVVPDYQERANRQWLPRTYRETGAFLLTRREYIARDSRIGETVAIFPLERAEAADIDTQMDWIAAEAALRRLVIAFVVNGNRQVGLGHLYRTLALADRFVGHQVVFFTTNSDDAALSLIERERYPVRQTAQPSLEEAIERARANLVINDILDTTREYIRGLRKRGLFVVNFEDLGPGADEAHVVINALYEASDPKATHRFGHEYECLADRFLLYPPIGFREPPRTLLLTFGGVDENDLTRRILKLTPKILRASPLERVIAIVGPGYAHATALQETEKTLEESDVEVHRSVENMPALMRKGDMAVTSNGRTVYELAAMGIPTISIAQNERETFHLFSRNAGGVRYLGAAPTVSTRTILEAITDIALNEKVRHAMCNAQLEEAGLLRGGTTRTVNEILTEYWRWRDARDSGR